MNALVVFIYIDKVGSQGFADVLVNFGNKITDKTVNEIKDYLQKRDGFEKVIILNIIRLDEE
jgi:hypothetical protein